MAIITISRELAALGDETANELAGLMNCRLVDKNYLENRIKSYGEAEGISVNYDEKKSSFLSSFSHNKDAYLHFLKTAILEEAGQNCIFIGRGAGMILKNIPGVFPVLLAAPMEIRLERVKSYFHCDEHHARQVISQSDRGREGFYRYFFDSEWQGSGNYLLTLNTGLLHPAVCAEIVKYTMDRTITPEADKQNHERINELRLEQTIKHNIIYQKSIVIHFLEVIVSKDNVKLYGVASSQALVEAAITIAKEIIPDAAVHSEIKVVQEYSYIP